MKKKHTSLKSQLLLSFCCVSVIPIILLFVISYMNSRETIRSSMDEMIRMNLKQTANSLNIWLESYEDILFQMYTDEDLIALVEKMNEGVDPAVTRNQIRSRMRALFYAKDNVRAISIITANREVIAYDTLVPTMNENSWMQSYYYDQEELYRVLSANGRNKVLPAHFATSFASDDYYLFHIGNRLIDYKNVMKDYGVVVVSIDETLLKNICLSKSRDYGVDDFNFIVDDEGRVVSYIDSTEIGRVVAAPEMNEAQRLEAYQSFICGTEQFKNVEVSLCVYRDEALGWSIVHVSNNNRYIAELQSKQELMLVAALLSMLAVVAAILLMTGRLTKSIKYVTETIRKVGQGDLTLRIGSQKEMPAEVEVIAVQFDNMLDKVEQSLAREKQANDRRRNAEIAALEAQINPHFIYNILDTINWMAIDSSEFKISNAISALAKILRYGIDNSSGVVTLREELEWLRQYIFLQQTRLKEMLSTSINVEPQLMECRIHKLLLQPFVENTFIHGFELEDREHALAIEIKQVDDAIKIIITDNGKGIPPQMVEKLNQGDFPEVGGKYNIGVKNAVTRIKMYYGEKSNVTIKSTLGEGTEVTLLIPREAVV